MTAEACVMNKLGIALATDSAVTATQSGKFKIYQSADKLFQLSEADPVAAMVYGSASFLDVPWETIIKQYRGDRGRTSRATVYEYADDFIRFLESNRNLFPSARQKFWLPHSVLAEAYGSYLPLVKDGLNRALEAALSKHGKKLSEQQVKRTVASAVRRMLIEVRKIKLLEGLTNNHITSVHNQCSSELLKLLNGFFQALPMSQATERDLQLIISQLYCRRLGERAVSGVVIAGFGRKDVFPSLANLELSGMVANKLRRGDLHKRGINDQTSAYIVPFAQKEMVSTFMGGINPGLQGYVSQTLKDVFKNLPEIVAGALPSKLSQHRLAFQKKLTVAMSEILSELISGWQDYQRTNYSGPIMDVVGVLPKDELASMAESLVNLTVLRRRTSIDIETVGAPVDVAIITKGDGFVWIRRKHYFDPALNPRYMSRLSEGAGS